MKWWNVRGTWALFLLLAFSFGYSSLAKGEYSFVSKWDTTRVSEGSSAANQITLPLEPIGTYNFVVQWGDGRRDTITSGTAAQRTHTYSSPGTYTITIDGTISGFRFNNSGDKLKILNIGIFGPLKLGNSGFYFYGAKNLTITATDPLDLRGTTILVQAFRDCTSLTKAPSMILWNTSEVVAMQYMFMGAEKFNENLRFWNTAKVKAMNGMFLSATAFDQDISNWNTGSVTNMAQMFYLAKSFNQNIGGWNTSQVTDMSNMFNSASAFNQNIGGWNTGNVTSMEGMFWGATAFNQNIGAWNTSKVTNMRTMFYLAAAFNQPIGNWNTSAVTNMANMFNSVPTFNQNIGGWKTSNVTTMEGMFWGAVAFNQNIGSWNTSKVTNMRTTFYGAAAFNQPIGEWDTSLVSDMAHMFNSASAFNQNVGRWNTGNVTTMEGMFHGAVAFNQDIGFWNTVKVTNMRVMFHKAAQFNQPISKWNTMSVTNMADMFNAAAAFNQNLGGWNIARVTNLTNMLVSSGLTQPNYDALLLGWSAQSVQPSLSFHAGTAKYSAAAEKARGKLTSPLIAGGKGWVIRDGGFVAPPEAPTNVSIAGSESLQRIVMTLSWTQPTKDGGSPITGYSYQYSSDGGTSWTNSPSLVNSPASATIVDNGLFDWNKTYLFRVAAINSVGQGVYSSPSNAFGPPGAPTDITGVPGDGLVTLSWKAPTETGGSSIWSYGYNFSTDGGITWSGNFRTSSSTTTHVVRNLVNGTAYVFKMWSMNISASSADSPKTNSFTPFSRDLIISRISPAQGSQGTAVILSGQNFRPGVVVVANLKGETNGLQVCELGKDPICVLSSDGTQINLTALPPLPAPMTLPADLEVRVLFNGKVSSTFASFRYIRPPSISFLLEPSDQTAQNGSATFSAQAIINSDSRFSALAIPQFQWQVSKDGGGTFTDLSGSTGFDLKLSGLDFTSNNFKYRVVASSPSIESKTSRVATLTVTPPRPTIFSVGSTVPNGTYRTGDIIPITVRFSNSVVVTGSPTLTLETGDFDGSATFSFGSGSNELTFNYMVRSGDLSSDLDYISSSALSLQGGRIQSKEFNLDAILDLPEPGAVNSLSSNKNIVIKGFAPLSLLSINISSGRKGDSFTLTGTGFEAGVQVLVNPGGEVGSTDGAGAPCRRSADSTQITCEIPEVPTEVTLPQDFLISVRNRFGEVTPNSVRFTYLPPERPAVVMVGSSAPNGSFGPGQSIPILVNFSRPVRVLGTPTLLLETGVIDRAVSFSFGSGTTTLVFDYIVQEGEESLDLDYVNNSALALNGGSISDVDGFGANLNLPLPGSLGSLAANKDIQVRTVVEPDLTNVLPTQAKVGEPITISGSNFMAGMVVDAQPPGATRSFNVCVLGDANCSFDKTSIRMLKAPAVPAEFGIVLPQEFEIRMTFFDATGPKRSKSFVKFTLNGSETAAPIVSAVEPARVAPSQSVFLSGSHLENISSIEIGGVSAPVSKEAGRISFTVPAEMSRGEKELKVKGVVQAPKVKVEPFCNPDAFTNASLQGKNLAINDPSIANNDLARFKSADLGNSTWSFGYLMGRIAGFSTDDTEFEGKTSRFIENWINSFQVGSVNGHNFGGRVFDPASFGWNRNLTTGLLDLQSAPVRLMAIMYRPDLTIPGKTAGEGRFVYQVGGSSFTVILEYGLPIDSVNTAGVWAERWANLSSLQMGSSDYVLALKKVTAAFTDQRFNERPNGSAINQVRTNEIALGGPWQLREWTLRSSDGTLTNVPLVPDTVKQTPNPQVDKNELQAWWSSVSCSGSSAPSSDCSDNMPQRFLAGAANTDGQSFGITSPKPDPLVPNKPSKFDMITCNGCHDPSNTGPLIFVHVQPGIFSDFLKGDLVLRRKSFNEALLSNFCP